ncbi:MAG: metallophosphoesterase [Williamsia sp.]|nr:metallophosphoesterase [Williamsia sp.]
MKLIVIGDTHGKRDWKKLVDTQSFDKFVFIGDYFDSFLFDAAEQISNFLDIIACKKAYPEKIILLTGNHDFHYLPVARQRGEVYSGFQDRHAAEIGELIKENLRFLQMCYKEGDYLFSHAGLTHTWLNNAGYVEGEVSTFINALFKTQPEKFSFNGWNPYGDNVTQSPIWVRPASLKKNAYKYESIKQVVGHTRVEKIEIVKDRYYFIDTLDSSREYLIVEDGNARAGKMG